jgi:hypothetical protein
MMTSLQGQAADISGCFSFLQILVV